MADTYTPTHTYTDTPTHTDTHADSCRHTPTHIPTQTPTHTYTHAGTYLQTHTDTDTYLHRHIPTQTHQHIPIHTQTHTDTHIHRHTDTYRHTHRPRHIDTYRHTHRHTHTDTHTDTHTAVCTPCSLISCAIILSYILLLHKTFMWRMAGNQRAMYSTEGKTNRNVHIQQLFSLRGCVHCFCVCSRCYIHAHSRQSAAHSVLLRIFCVKREVLWNGNRLAAVRVLLLLAEVRVLLLLAAVRVLLLLAAVRVLLLLALNAPLPCKLKLQGWDVCGLERNETAKKSVVSVHEYWHAATVRW